MKRVLQVFHGMDCGGAENMIMNLYRKIDKRRVQFDFLVHTDKKCFFDDEIKSLGGNLYRVPYFKGTNQASYKKALDEFFSLHPEIKIVHGHLGSCAHIYLDVAKKHGVKAIAHSHNTDPGKLTIKNIMYKLYTKKTVKVADFFFGCSDKAGADRFGEEITKQENYAVLNNAVETEKYEFNKDTRDKIRKELNLGDKFIVGHVGGFREQKNHRYLIDIFKEISEKRDDAHLLLVGGGGESLRAEIVKKVEDLGLKDKVTFTGVRPNVNELLQAMDCFVFPSFYEGLPVTVIEAQTTGIPCFISDNITDEVCLTDLVEKISINVGADIWCEKILEKTKDFERVSPIDTIKDAGYDISQTAKWLTDFYINLN